MYGKNHCAYWVTNFSSSSSIQIKGLITIYAYRYYLSSRSVDFCIAIYCVSFQILAIAHCALISGMLTLEVSCFVELVVE